MLAAFVKVHCPSGRLPTSVLQASTVMGSSGHLSPVAIDAAAPNDLVASQDFIISAASANVEVRMGVPELLHFPATVKECLKLFVRHTLSLTTNYILYNPASIYPISVKRYTASISLSSK